MFLTCFRLAIWQLKLVKWYGYVMYYAQCAFLLMCWWPASKRFGNGEICRDSTVWSIAWRESCVWILMTLLFFFFQRHHSVTTYRPHGVFSKIRDFLIYSGWSESWQRKLTTEDTEDTESHCFFSLCPSVYSVVFRTIPENNKKSSISLTLPSHSHQPIANHAPKTIRNIPHDTNILS